MPKRLSILVALFVVFVLTSALPVSPAYASPTQELLPFSHTFDFSFGNDSSWYAEDFWISQNCPAGGCGHITGDGFASDVWGPYDWKFQVLYVRVDFSAVYVSKITFEFDVTYGENCGDNTTYKTLRTWDGDGGQYLDLGEGHIVLEAFPGGSITTIGFWSQAGCNKFGQDPGGSVLLTSVVVEGTSEDGVDPFLSQDPNAGPYRPLRDDVLYEVNHVEGFGPVVDDVHTELSANAYNSFDGTVVAIEAAGNGYLVKVVDEYDRYTLYSNLESVYPQLNDEITAGCVIGTVGASFKTPSNGPYTQDPGLLWFYAGTDFYTAASNEYIDWQTEWSEPPVGGSPCGTELRTDNCLNYNPRLDDRARGWSFYKIDELDIGLSKTKLSEYGAYVYQTTILDYTLDYYVTLKVSSYQDYSLISLMVLSATTGSVVDQHLIPLDLATEGVGYGDAIVKTIGPLDLSNYDVNDAYDIAVVESNPNHSQVTSVWVDDVCVHDGAVVVSVPSCYFPDADLEDTAQWDYDAGVNWTQNPTTFGSGPVLGPAEWISGPVSLSSYAEDDAEYILTLSAKVTGIDIGDLTEIFGGWLVDTHQQVMDGVTLELDIGDVEIRNALITLNTDTRFTVPDNETLIGDLTITNDAANTKNLYLEKICIAPVTGIWPGTEDPDIPADPVSNCAACAMPTGIASVSWFEWLSWLWCNLLRFFNCTLATWLAAIGAWLQTIRDLVGQLGRYIALLVTHVTQWLLQLVNAFASALGDVIAWILAGLWNALASLALIRYLFDLIGYIIALISGIIAFALSIVNLFGSLVSLLITLANLIAVFISSLSVAWSGSATTITLPTCAAVTSPLQDGYCLVFTLADGVFTEFPSLVTGFAINAGVIGLITIIWTIRQVGGALSHV